MTPPLRLVSDDEVPPPSDPPVRGFREFGHTLKPVVHVGEAEDGAAYCVLENGRMFKAVRGQWERVMEAIPDQERR